MKNATLDTNIYSALKEGDRVVKNALSTAEHVGIFVVVLGELLYGFKKGTRELENLKILKDFVRDSEIATYKTTSKTAKIYSDLKYKLTKKGYPVPENDVWIAASAIETNSILITYDKHFLKIPKVKVWKNLK